MQNGDAMPAKLKLRDNMDLAPAFPSEKFIEAMSNDPDFSITLLDCKKFGGRCSSQNEGCVKMRSQTNIDSEG